MINIFKKKKKYTAKSLGLSEWEFQNLKQLEKDYKRDGTHEVTVYDMNGNILEKCQEHPNISYMVRWEHNICGEIYYSFNNHHYNGLISYGMIYDNGFSNAKLIIK